MAATQDTPGTPGREDLGRGQSGEESFGGALLTGTDAPEDPWARVAEQLEWEQRRGVPLAPDPSSPLAAESSATGPRPGPLAIPAAPWPVAVAADADLPTKPSLPEVPAQLGQWRAQALARGLHSVFVTAADDFTSAPPPSPGLELLAAPPEIQVAPVAVHAPALASADQPQIVPGPPTLPAATSSAESRPAPESATPRRPGQRAGGLLGAVQRPVSPRAPEKPPAQEPAPAAASSSPLSRAGLRALAAEADQAVRQSVQRGKTLLQRLLRPDQSASPPQPPEPD